MVVRMAWGMHGADGGAFDPEYLTIRDGLLGFARCVLVDR